MEQPIRVLTLGSPTTAVTEYCLSEYSIISSPDQSNINWVKIDVLVWNVDQWRDLNTTRSMVEEAAIHGAIVIVENVETSPGAQDVIRDVFDTSEDARVLVFSHDESGEMVMLRNTLDRPFILPTVEDTWTEIDAPNPPSQRIHHKAVVMGPSMYIFGGLGNFIWSLNDLHVLDTSTPFSENLNIDEFTWVCTIL